MHADILLQISLAILVATGLALLAKLLRQPLILAYIAGGIIVGAVQGFGWVQTDVIEPISELGLILLLFMIGLEIDLKKLKSAGAPVLATGIVQFFACVGLGFAFFPLIGFSLRTGGLSVLYLSVACALSSTMIVVKLLYDKFEIDTVPGRITLGVLVFQDIWAILFLAIQHDLSHPRPLLLLLSLAKGIAVVAVAFAASRYLLPILFRSIAKSPELVLISALAWCFGVAMVASYVGLSREMGALIAGVAISTFPYNMDIVAKIITLRDFFVTLFFVTLGTKVPRPTFGLLLIAVGVSIFLNLSRFLTVFPVLHRFKEGNRASFLPALNLGQISEFSLVICALGVSVGHISDRILSVVLYTLVITSVTSTYAIMASHRIFTFVNRGLIAVGIHDLGDPAGEMEKPEPRPIVFLGFSRASSSMLVELLEMEPERKDEIAIIDFNPEAKAELDRRGLHVIYGDISHRDVLHHAGVEEAKLVISTIPDSLLKGTSNLKLLRMIRGLAPEADVIVTAEFFSHARELYAAGATFVFIPRLMSAVDLAGAVFAIMADQGEQLRERAQEALRDRDEVLP
ncbi:transporter, CPA2 family (2.A.37) [Candidatus Koribacter versatilis Ellin345]|uniref:Transporter, CPA2 family (2.A.37) n=1 Tax=Koribacter versatilis (strain Ellin345) TaxID=204669 RepID=Q1IMX7_KORVE|nr:cation:proton antiporter [Candidatus Koribacter versatilis]ABF41773.1 transporter, CPA2 family (2.A.37) [Candidatus Koribacter versatilis Ellin345]